MARPRTPLNSYGSIAVAAVEYVPSEGRRRLRVVPGADRRKHPLWRARTRYRFDNGDTRMVERFAESPAKAEAALRLALTVIAASSRAEVRRETRIKDLGERFIASKTKIAPRTLADYTRIVRNVIVPRIGDLAVSEAGPDRLQRVLDSIAAESGPGAAKTARAVLSGMMGLAARSEAVRANPVRELERMSSSGNRAAIAVPLDELPALLDAVRADEGLRALDMVDVIVFCAGTGVRIGEACALRWDDVNLDTGVVLIRKSKTDAGVRRLSLSAAVVAMLVERRVKGGPNDDGVVFPTPLGRTRDPRAAARDWASARARLGLNDRYTFHAFRKTMATLLDQAGLTARDIAEYLGHVNPALTQTVYMSKTVGGTRAAEAIDAALSS